MNYVIDTVTITRHFSGAGKIGSKASRIIREAEEGKHTLFISVVSLFEIMYLAEKNRIKVSLKNTISTIQKKQCYIIVDLNTEIILQAEAIGLSILSSDKRFDELKEIVRIW